MRLLRGLALNALVNRLLGGRGGHRPGGPSDPYGMAPRYGPRYGPQPPMYPPRRGRGGIFPIPHYSGTTRRGTRVSVGGCCLPIPLMVLTTAGAVTLLSSRSGGR